jgi:hypothetical protein
MFHRFPQTLSVSPRQLSLMAHVEWRKATGSCCSKMASLRHYLNMMFSLTAVVYTKRLIRGDALMEQVLLTNNLEHVNRSMDDIEKAIFNSIIIVSYTIIFLKNIAQVIVIYSILKWLLTGTVAFWQSAKS